MADVGRIESPVTVQSRSKMSCVDCGTVRRSRHHSGGMQRCFTVNSADRATMDMEVHFHTCLLYTSPHLLRTLPPHTIQIVRSFFPPPSVRAFHVRHSILPILVCVRQFCCVCAAAALNVHGAVSHDFS